MAIENYVGQILNSPVYVFDGIIDKLIGKNIHAAKIELTRYRIEIDAILIDSIKSILSDIREEEGVVSRFLYVTFGFEFRKNKRRKQLLYLGSELKTQHSKIKRKLHALHRQKERLTYSITDLGRLKEGFSEKNLFFESDKVKNKSKFYMNEIEGQIKQLQECQFSLLMKYNDLYDLEKVYQRLYKRIPRYQELREETHLLLASSSKK